MVDATQYLGVTAPLAVNPPTEKELKLTQDLIETLKENNAYDNEPNTWERKQFLKYCQETVKDTVQQICQRKHCTLLEMKQAGGKVVTYGSFHLGVHSPESDIDTLCVIPNLVTRKEFFHKLAGNLSEHPKVKKMNVITDSFVPVIKFYYGQISIDLVCARLDVPSVPDDLDLNDTELLRNIDAYSVRSINGHRVSNDILRLVPDVDTYRTSLRCIKLWASRKSLSSNVLGFLGGIAWALLVARICQLYPLACPSTIISKFFHILMNWNWPSPVMLRNSESGPELPDRIQPWNPRQNLQDRVHRMPIITPAYPSMCTTHNVTESTFRVITSEFKRAITVVNSIMDHGASWNTLFTNDIFFDTYPHYLQVVVSSNQADTIVQWSGYIESRLRLLVTKLEAHPDILLAHPYPKGYNYHYPCENKASVVLANHGQAPPADSDSEGFVNNIAYTKIFYLGLYISPYDGNSTRIDLSRTIMEFIKLTKNCNTFNKKTMGLVIEPLYRSQLPDDILQQGD